MTQDEFYRSQTWRRVRKAYIEKRITIDGGLCEVCQKNLGKVVHHIEWIDDIKCNIPSIALNEDNFRYECQDCHNKEQDPRKPARNGGRIAYNADGSIVEIK